MRTQTRREARVDTTPHIASSAQQGVSVAKLKKNEWNFAANAAALITRELSREEFASSSLGHAEAELTEYKGAKRLDLVVFERDNKDLPGVTGELKTPWSEEGRTPYNDQLVEGAHAKAAKCGATFFVTWNMRRAVI